MKSTSPSFRNKPESAAIPKEIFSQVRKIEIKTQKLVTEIFSGQYSSVFKGHGIEFSQVREYQPGDDIKRIDWNVSARLGHLYTKEFLEERELTVLILLDASKSLFFGSRSRLKSETAAELSALLSFAAIRNQDKVGLLIFTDRVEKYIPPRKGRLNTLRLIREILTFEPQGGGTRLDVGLEYIGKVLKRRAVCFLISDFLSPIEYENALKVIAKKHDLTAIRMTDRLEKNVPLSGRFRWRDMESQNLGFLNLKNQQERDQLMRELERYFSQWRSLFRKYRIDILEIETGEDYIQQLILYFKSREKRFR